MAEIIACPKCARKLQVPEPFLGQTVQCPECRHSFVAQQSAVSATPLPAGPASSPGKRDAERGGSRYEDDEDDDFPHGRPIRRDFAPHRGGLVLALGIAALVGGFSFCLPVVIGPIAWVLGSIDLREIREGRMDPTGEGMTRSGQICGIVATLFLLLGLLFLIAIFAVG